MEKLYSSLSSPPSITHLTAFFRLLTWGHGATINRDELFLILIELLVIKLPFDEGFESIWKGLMKLVEASNHFSLTLLFLFIQTQVHLFKSLFPSVSMSNGRDFSNVFQTLRTILITHTPTLSKDQEAVMNSLGIEGNSSYFDLFTHPVAQTHSGLMKAILTSLLQENLLRVDMVLMNHSNPYYTRVHILQQYLGVENQSIQAVVEIVMRHTTDLSDQLMSLRELLQVFLEFLSLYLVLESFLPFGASICF